jgi:hypothetical protein
MHVLFRVALAVLIGIPMCLVLVIFFMFASRSGGSTASATGAAGSSARTHLGSERAQA